jgi:hypothetical protein
MTAVEEGPTSTAIFLSAQIIVNIKILGAGQSFLLISQQRGFILDSTPHIRQP